MVGELTAAFDSIPAGSSVQHTCVALRGIAWHCVALRGIAWHCVALRGLACTGFGCPCLPPPALHAAWVRAALAGCLNLSLGWVFTAAPPLLACLPAATR